MLYWKIEERILTLKYTWKISRNQSDQKLNFFITVTDGLHTGVGEVAPNIRYGETPELIRSSFDQFISTSESKNGASENLLSILPNALRFGIDSAFVHFQAAKSGKQVFDFLGLNPPTAVATSYTIPIMEPRFIRGFIIENNLNRFESLKLKVNAENAADLTKALAKEFNGPIRVDANEAFKEPSDVLKYLKNINGINLEILEQPFPVDYKEQQDELKRIINIPVFADESVTDHPDMKEIAKLFDGVNMKLMKAGSYRNGIRILSEAKTLGLKTMVGCMVETSLGISSGINISSLCDYSDLDGHYLLDADPFNFVREQTGKLFLS